MLVGAQAPTLVLLLSAVGLFPVETALNLAQGVIVLLLFGYGLRVGQLLHHHWLRHVVSGLVLLAIAGLLVGIKAVFH